ncbi:FISUMP domain-containing protein [Fibrobacter sp. UBA4297]|uniref:FISUMP domain-containing protein n=1 Tax=Fibrobacter sp. UBA4297 TaxID=1946536 RepID=UPI0025C05B4C|nr:FISUMP domain-containing protein [Fibrobacter sp. UBA4297]
MKHSRQNSLLRDFIGAAFCLVMAFALLMMYVGCSEEVNHSPLAHEGGSTEETASLENITVKGLALASVRQEPLDTSKPEVGLSIGGMPKGSIVTLYELDGDSLEKTGVSYADTIDNDGGLFNIQGVTLKSPYVWITAVAQKSLTVSVDCDFYGCGGDGSGDALSLNAFIDVRDTTPVTVDVFSDLIAYRARVLMLIGNDFADAMAQAKREILEAFGLYGITFDSLDVSGLDYYAMQSVFVKVMVDPYANGDSKVEASISKSFEQTGSFMREKNTVKNGVMRAVNDLKFKLSIPQGVYDNMGPQVAREYQAMLLYEKYLAGMMSVVLGSGQCTSELEGTVVDVTEGVYVSSNAKFNIACRSGSWHVAYEQVPHTFGTMTDARDGKVYKTVTIDFGDKSQTWMAENLNYSGVKTSCLDGNEQNCAIYGRQYNWLDAVGLDESVLSNEFESIQECIDSLSPRYSTTPIPYDSAYIAKCIAELEEPDEYDIEKCEYYGGGIPVNYDSLRVVYDAEILERCEQYMSDMYKFIDINKVNLDSLAVTQGVCPDGWRIPTLDDWETIFVYVDQRWRSAAEAAFLLAAPSIGDPFGFNLYNTVAMEWGGNRSLKIEKKRAEYIMISTSNDRHLSYAGRVKSIPRMNTAYTFSYDVVSFDSYYENLFVRCIKD